MSQAITTARRGFQQGGAPRESLYVTRVLATAMYTGGADTSGGPRRRLFATNEEVRAAPEDRKPGNPGEAGFI